MFAERGVEMLAVFCLRLAVGMIATLLLLSPSQIQPRYYRVHFLIAFGLTATALFDPGIAVDFQVRGFSILGLVLAFAGSFSWSLEQTPFGRTLIVATGVCLAATLLSLEISSQPTPPIAWVLLGDVASAAVLGTTLSAMLLGHHYLVAPSMSIKPLLNLLGAMTVALCVRMAVDGAALAGSLTQGPTSSLDSDMMIWLPARWLIGFVGPLALTWMAWQTAKIRSTQSATGILYVVVIFTFLGELTSQLLRDKGVTL